VVCFTEDSIEAEVNRLDDSGGHAMAIVGQPGAARYLVESIDGAGKVAQESFQAYEPPYPNSFESASWSS